eukprot:6219512-Alexandrium_andersonii.AAC.1
MIRECFVAAPCCPHLCPSVRVRADPPAAASGQGIKGSPSQNPGPSISTALYPRAVQTTALESRAVHPTALG